MNQGQFEAITSRLDRLIELLEEQVGNEIDRMNKINKSYPSHESPVTEEQPKPAAKPAKRGKAA